MRTVRTRVPFYAALRAEQTHIDTYTNLLTSFRSEFYFTIRTCNCVLPTFIITSKMVINEVKTRKTENSKHPMEYQRAMTHSNRTRLGNPFNRNEFGEKISRVVAIRQFPQLERIDIRVL